MNAKTILLILLFILFTSVTVSASDENIIYLKVGNLDTDNYQKTNTTHTSSTVALAGSENFDDSEKYYVVQFDGHVTGEWKDEVENTGAQVLDYIPNNAYVLKMTEAEKEQVNSLGFIRWSGEYLPEYKYESETVESGEKLIIILFEQADSAKVSEDIENIGGTITSSSGKILGVRINSGKTDEITAIEGIAWIESSSEPVPFNDVATGIMNIDTVSETSGLTGSGQIVAVSDTGIDTGVNDNSMHPDLMGRIREIIDYSDDGAADEGGHGTIVAGSIIGNGAMSEGQYSGAAPGARLVFQALQDDDGGLGGVQKDNINILFEDAYDSGARIHSNSWGYTDELGLYSSVAMQVDDFVWKNPDMLILFSAGNEASDSNSNGVVDHNSVTSPATSKNSIAVGATESYRPGTAFRYGFPAIPIINDDIADNTEGMYASSGRGPTDDGRIKPDLVAPGTLIASTKSSLVSSYSLEVINDYYAYAAGTSFATPLVAGTAALVREYYTEFEQLGNLKCSTPESNPDKRCIRHQS
ncbi:MAG: S8 family serine peptidase [Methanolobus sp.]